MSGRARVALAVGALMLAAVVFIAVRPSGDSSSGSTTATAATAAPAVIRVRAASPSAACATSRQAGRRIRFTCRDAPEHVHLHGYDIEKPVGRSSLPGTTPATINGVFVIELEDAREQIACSP